MKNLIRIFTPSDAAEADTNAQNLTAKEIIARLPADSFHVTMMSDGEPDPRLLNRTNTELIPWTKHGNTLRVLKDLLYLQPDIYFFPRFGPLDRAFFELRKRLLLRTRLVTYIVTGVHPKTWSGLLIRLIKESDFLCANSGVLSRTIQERFSRPSTVVFDGVDKRYFFPSAKLRTDRLTVLYAGSFLPNKRAEMVIEQAARLPNIEFRLAGRGPTEPACRTLCEQLNCTNVSFLGLLTPAYLGNEMRRADVFLFPSIVEGNPQVLLQAAASGLPCVAMNLYNSEYVVNDETGYRVGDDRTLSDKLDVLLDNHELRARMSQAAVKHALGFDWDRIAEQWAEIFKEVVTAKSYESARAS